MTPELLEAILWHQRDSAWLYRISQHQIRDLTGNYPGIENWLRKRRQQAAAASSAMSRKLLNLES